VKPVIAFITGIFTLGFALCLIDLSTFCFVLNNMELKGYHVDHDW
jgi:hypothetical protein